MTYNKEKYYKLILFNNINESKQFILNIIQILHKYDNIYYIDNKNLEFNDNLCVCNIIDINEPKWKSDCIFIINNNDIININNYRLVIYKFDNLIYYIEKNGDIREINNFIRTFKYYNYKNFKISNINYIDSIYKLNKKISNYLLGRNYFNDCYKKFCNKYRIPIINYINDDNDNYDNYDNEFSYNNIINLFEDLINNKILDSNKKLNDFNLNICINNNENRYYKNIKKYNFLNLDNSDNYYDKENKLLFNYKTIKGYSLLNYQIIFYLILLKTRPNKDLCLNFINKFNIDIDNFKYVIGIIKNNDYDDIDFKMSIGTICYFLNKLNIEYYIDVI